ncbi:MAG: hypothetical protein EOP49_49230, partial [Sphingobacteriales bacterium]
MQICTTINSLRFRIAGTVSYVIVMMLMLHTQNSFGQDAGSQARVKEYNVESGKPAIAGYDPVSYFNQNKAIRGTTAHTLKHEGITYRFATAANLEAFRKEPGRYEPQYGGWCAYAMGNDGSKVEVDPETFRILNGKLYLFYNSLFNNTLKTWL